MNLKTRLSQRIGINDIHEITYLTQGNDTLKQELYELLSDEDDLAAYQAAWVFCHFSRSENEWLYPMQNELIDGVMVCSHPGKRRLLLNLILRQPMPGPPRTDFLDFCMDRMLSKQELPGVQSLAMKLAYEMCRPIPELLHELYSLLEIMDTHMLLPSMRAVRKNTMKQITQSLKKR